MGTVFSYGCTGCKFLLTILANTLYLNFTAHLIALNVIKYHLSAIKRKIKRVQPLLFVPQLRKVQRRYKYVPNNSKHRKINNNCSPTKRLYMTVFGAVCNVFLKCLFCSSYFPIQNRPNIELKTSSLVTSPVIKPRWCNPFRISKATKSLGMSLVNPSNTVCRASELFVNASA